MRIVAALSAGSLFSLLPPAGPRYRLSSVLPVVLRGWLIEAQRVGHSGLTIEHEGNLIVRVELQDVAPSTELVWRASGAVVASVHVELVRAAADLRAIGQLLKEHEQAGVLRG